MKIGIVVHPAEIRSAEAAGFDYVELSARDVCAMDQAEFERIPRDSLPILGMNAFCPPEILLAGEGFSAEAMEQYCSLCAKRASDLGVRVVGIGSPRSRMLSHSFSRDLARRQIREVLQIAAKHFGPYGIAVGLEALATCYCNFINSVKEASQIVRDADLKGTGIVLDFYNMEHEGEADADLSSYAAKVLHAHISDDDGSPLLRSYLHPQKTSSHQARIARLTEAGYTGMLTLEVDVPFDSQRARESLEIMRGRLGTTELIQGG